MTLRANLSVFALGSALAGSVVPAVGCGAGGVGEAVRPPDPTAAGALGEPDAEASCRAVGSYAEPLVVDLRSNERLDLELAMKEGVAVVAYDCKSLKLLRGCKLAGSYGFAGVSRKEDVVQIASSDELAANLPFSAATLSSELSRGSSIDLALVMVGRKGTTLESAASSDLIGSCEGATHFIKSATVGAFAMSTGTRGQVRAAADIFGFGAKGASESEKRTANRDGDPEACKQAKSDASAPPDQCQSPVRVGLVAVSSAQKSNANAPASPPSSIANPCPDGMVLAGGKCTANAEKPHLCKKDDAAECTAQCDAGDPGSCFHLSWLYAEGKGVERSAEKTTALREKACAGGVGMACYYRGDEYMVARMQAKSDDAKLAARIEAERFYDQACKLGEAWVCYNISPWYLREGALEVFPKDPARAMSLVRRSCDLGYRFGCSALAKHLVDGVHTKQDVPAAMGLFQRSCDAGNWEDCESIGNLYRAGRGVNKNPVAAIAAYERSCDKGGARACHSGGKLYEQGEGLPKDAAKARAFYEKGCTESAPGWDACKSLGESLEKGLGGPKDFARAAVMYERGCMNGGCLRAGQIWEKGEGGVPADAARALAAYEKGCRQNSGKEVCLGYGRMLEKSDVEKAKSFWVDHCNRMGSGPEKWGCTESKRLGGTGKPDPAARGSVFPTKG